MKKRLNKIPINYSVELTQQEVTNLSETLSAVRTAGGGTGGVYIGDGQYIGVDNTNNKISFLPDAATKLESVSNKLDESTYAADSATFLTAHQSLSGYYQKTETSSKEQLSTEFEKYQTVADMAEYLTTSNAQTTYLTKSSAEENLAPISVTADVEVLKANSGDFSQYYKKTDTSSKEELSAEFDKYQTKEDMVNYATEQELANTITYLDTSIALKQNKLTFGYNENNAISSINDSALAGQGGKTYSAGAGIDIVDEYISLSADYIQAITQVSGKQDKLEFTYDNSGSIIKINNSAIAGGAGGGSVSYTGRNGVEINGNYIELETTAKNAIDSVGGISTDVGTLKTASAGWDKVSEKLDTTAFSTVSGTFLTTIPDTYATKEYANNASANALSEAKTWVGQQGYITQETDWTNTIQEASAKAYNDATANANSLYQTKGDYVKNTDIGLNSNNKVTAISGKELIITAHQSLTNYYTKSETSGATELSTEFANYQPTGDYLVADDITGKLDKSIYANASGNWENTYNVVNQYSAAGTWLTEHQSLINYYTKDQTSGATQLSTEFGKYLTKTIADGYYYPLSTNPSNYATSAGLTQSKQYAMTTTGWSEITGGGSTFTGVTTASPITGDGLNNTLGLDSNYKTAIEQVSGKVDKPADMTSNIPYCFSAGQWADITKTYYSKTEATGTFLQKHLTNTLSGDGTSNNTLGVNWSNLSGNTIASAEKAGEAQGFRWGDNTYQDTSAALTNLWNSKNHVTLQSANNILTVDNNDNTSATLSAMSYVNNTLNNRAFLPQKACVCLESEITTMATLSNGQGMLFFVVSAH